MSMERDTVGFTTCSEPALEITSTHERTMEESVVVAALYPIIDATQEKTLYLPGVWHKL